MFTIKKQRNETKRKPASRDIGWHPCVSMFVSSTSHMTQKDKRWLNQLWQTGKRVSKTGGMAIFHKKGIWLRGRKSIKHRAPVGGRVYFLQNPRAKSVWQTNQTLNHPEITQPHKFGRKQHWKNQQLVLCALVGMCANFAKICFGGGRSKCEQHLGAIPSNRSLYAMTT